MFVGLLAIQVAAARCGEVRRVGEVAGHPVAVTDNCWAEDDTERIQVHWHGPAGRESSSLYPQATIDHSLDEVWLEGDTLHYSIEFSYPYGMGGTSYHVARFDPASRWFLPEPLPTLRSQLAARLERGDWEVVGGAVGRRNSKWGSTPDYTDVSAILTALRDHAVALLRQKRSREAADQILGLMSTLTLRDDFQPCEGACLLDERDELRRGEPVEVLNDLGYVLEQGGEPAAAEALLRTVVKVAPSRNVARLNLADALWRQGKDEARTWYAAYLEYADAPARWARERVDAKVPAPAKRSGGAARRYAQALGRGDLIAAAGAARSEGRVAGDDPDWWRAGAKELRRRMSAGDTVAVPAILRLLRSTGTLTPASSEPLRRELWPTIERLAQVQFTREWLGGGWLRPDERLEDALLLARWSPDAPGCSAGHYREAMALGDAAAVVDIDAADGSLSVRTIDGKGVRGAAEPQVPRMVCDDAAWPCFAPTVTRGGTNCAEVKYVGPVCSVTDGEGPKTPWHACGVDEIGTIHCRGNDAVAGTAPPQGHGYWNLVGTDTRLCAIGPDEAAVCWGPDVEMRRVPGVVDVAVGEGWTCVLGLDGRVTCDGPQAPTVDAPAPPSFLGPDDYRCRLGMLRR